MTFTGLALAMMTAQAIAAPMAEPSTVNSFTPAEADRARAAVTRAGYTPEKIVAVQDGNFFFNAGQDGQSYQVTVTRVGKVYATGGTAAGM
jgi:hypothetical protein